MQDLKSTLSGYELQATCTEPVFRFFTSALILTYHVWLSSSLRVSSRTAKMWSSKASVHYSYCRTTVAQNIQPDMGADKLWLDRRTVSCVWSRSQLSPTVTSMVHFPLTFQLLSACIRLHALSDHRMKNSWKSLNAVSNLLATVLSVSLPQLSGICCLPACGISPPSLDFKAQLKTSPFQQAFPQI